MHHSDRGHASTCRSHYTERLAEVGIENSVGSVGDSYDNALAETVNGLVQDRGDRVNSADLGAALMTRSSTATLEWVDWFNNRRLMEPLGDVPPAEYEQEYYDAQTGQAMVA